MAGYAIDNYNLTGVGEPGKYTGVRTTGNLFTVLGMQPLLGRTLTAADDRPDAPPVVVLDERVWRARFAADPGILGRTIRLNGVPHTVAGIVPADFRFPNTDASLWVPAKFTAVELQLRSGYFMYVVARLRAGVGLAQAQADMDGLSRQLGREFPQSNGRTGATVAALHEHMTRDVRPTMALLLAAVGVVLLIAGANLASLLLTRGTGRLREVAVRQALGATAGRVSRQLLTENAVLAVLGAALGVALAAPLLRYLARLTPTALPVSTAPALDVTVLAFTAGVTMLMVLGFGGAPALAAARVDLEKAIRAGSRGTTDRGRLRSALVVAELALTVVLLVAAGLLLRSYANVLAADPGFNPRNLLVVETSLPPSKYEQTARRDAFYRAVAERVAAIPGVTAAGFANFPPLVFKGGRAFIGAEGEPPPESGHAARYMALDRAVTPGYLPALGVPIIRGRDFDARDAQSGVPVAIVNRTLAERRWPNQDPIGRRIKFGPANVPGLWLTVVGVVGDVKQTALDGRFEPEVYLPSNQGAGFVPSFLWPQHLVVRTTGDPRAFAAAVRSAVWSVDPEQAAANIRTMDDIFDAELQNRDTQLTLVGAFAILAFVMASVGLYGVLSYAVAQRLRDIGVRVALGAARATIVAETLRGALGLAAVGIGLGLGVAVVVSRALQVWLFEVRPLDAATFAGSAALLALMALLASAIPAARGASVDPVRVLRAE